MRAALAVAILVGGCAGPVIVAHRGGGRARAGEPEETIVAYANAARAGADAVEGDLHVTADGALVLVHDDTLDRTTNGHGCVSAATLAEARALGVATLAELLDATSLPVELEIKVPRPPCASIDRSAVVRLVADELRAHGAERRARVTSFDADVLRAMRKAAPDVDVALLVAAPVDLDAIRAAGVTAVEIDERALDAGTIDRLRAAGVEVGAWTVDDPDRAVVLARAGVVRIVTDVPSRLASRFSRGRPFR